MCRIWQWIAFGPRTFMVGHEIYHLITAQKIGDMPEEIRVFNENIYLSPAMLFEYFDLLDGYGALTGKAVSSADHPSPRVMTRNPLCKEMFAETFKYWTPA